MPNQGESRGARGEELRVFPLRELRVERRGEGQSPVIAGYAAVFSQLSEDLGGWREIIQPGFFDRVLEDDVRGLWNHNTDLVLGRTRSGTLRLQQDDQGLRIQIDPPATQWAQDALVTMERGDVDQMSFAFTVRAEGERWEQRPDGTIIRTLLAGGCAQLYDVSPVTYPAYPQTTVSVRSRAQEMANGHNAGGDGQGAVPPAGEGQGGTRARPALLKRLLDLAEREF